MGNPTVSLLQLGMAKAHLLRLTAYANESVRSV